MGAQPEPSDFDAEVRQKGQAWLLGQGIAMDTVPPKVTESPSYWTSTNKQLWDAYSRTCAYLAISFESPTGASSTDHFIAKSGDAGQAYECSNYRLTCLGATSRKNKFADVLDPIGLAPETFHPEFANGKIESSPSLNAAEQQRAKDTIKRLRLDSPTMREMRVRHLDDCAQGLVTPAYLKRLSPCVWYEATRQGLI